jgi:hypothetical protein
MNIENFEALLDRLGPDLSAWPAAKAEQARHLLSGSRAARQAHETLLRVESALALSRPKITSAQVSRVLSRSLLAIAEREAKPSFIERLYVLFAAPIPRAAFAMTLTAIGFGIGMAVGSPDSGRVADASNVPLVMASADDAPF